MELKVLLFGIAITSIGQIHGASYVRPISEQWPYSQWTTKLPPGQSTTTLRPPTTGAPPPEITFLPPLEEEKRYLIITDPSTGQTLRVPAHVFWERFGGVGQFKAVDSDSKGQTKTSSGNTPRNPFVCDFYARNCWLPTTTARTAAPSRGREPNFEQGVISTSGDSVNQRRPISQAPTQWADRRFIGLQTTVPSWSFENAPRQTGGGGAGSNIFGLSPRFGFHQGAFPQPQRAGNLVSEVTQDDFEPAASTNWNSFSVPSFGITSQTRSFFGNWNQNNDPVSFQRTFRNLPSDQFFEKNNPSKNTFYNFEREVSPIFTKGSGIGGFKSEGANSKGFSTTESPMSATLETKIRVTRPASTTNPKNSNPAKISATTENNPDYFVELNSE